VFLLLVALALARLLFSPPPVKRFLAKPVMKPAFNNTFYT